MRHGREPVETRAAAGPGVPRRPGACHSHCHLAVLSRRCARQSRKAVASDRTKSWARCRAAARPAPRLRQRRRVERYGVANHWQDPRAHGDGRSGGPSPN